MKTKMKLSYLILVLLPTFFVACTDSVTRIEEYTANVPVYMTKSEIRAQIKVTTEAVDMENPGKMYFYGNILFINELYKGIHVVDNSDPANPIKTGFIEVPANVDIAVKGSILYADSYTDLVALDISDMNNVTEVGRTEDVFEQLFPAWDVAYPLGEIDETRGLVVGWTLEKVRTKTDVDFTGPSWGIGAMESAVVFDLSMSKGTDGMNTAQASVVSAGGSLARFLIYNNYMYTVHAYSLQVFDISTPSSPVQGAKVDTWHMVETISRRNDNIFIGTTGMLIYSIANPAVPEYVSDVQHWTACDPVVVEDDIAYVTLRGGTRCGSNMNLLQVYDVSDVYQPQFIAQYEMNGPYGLGIDNGVLFVCDGDAGLKVFDATDSRAITDNQLASYPHINAYDVIPVYGVLMMIGSDGLYQYDYSDLNDIKLLSKLEVVKPVE